MRWRRLLTVVDAHAEGEVGRVVTGGVIDVPGASMLEKRAWLAAEGDDLRRLLLFEPRGAPNWSANLILKPTRADADAGLIVMESTDYPPMSGSNAMCAVTVLLETGIVRMREPETRVTLDTPAGLVVATARCEGGRCRRVTLESAPSFLVARDARFGVPGLGEVRADIAYGGAFFAIVDAAALGLGLVPGEARRLVDLGQRITAAAAAAFPVVHPETPEIAGVTFTLFAGPLDDAGQGRSAVVVAPGRLDRSPCGTGTMARLAALHARGALARGRPLVHEALAGGRFVAEVAGETRVGPFPAIVPRLSGRAWITGIAQVGVADDDPFAAGFTMGDTWGSGAGED